MVMPLGNLGILINNIFLIPISMTVSYLMGHYFIKAIKTIWTSSARR